MTPATRVVVPVSRRPIAAESVQLGLILSLGAALRLYRMTGWNANEAFLFVASSGSLRAAWDFIAREDPFHPPLFAMLLHLWRFLGESEIILRLLPITFGLLSIVMIYRLARYLFGQPIAVLSAIIVAVSPFHVFHSQEIRMYSLAFFLSLVALDALARILREGGARHWLVYAAAATLSLYTDYGAFVMLAAHNLGVAVLTALRRGPRLFTWAAVQFLILVAYAPWWPMLLGILLGHGPVRSTEVTAAPASVPAPASLQTIAFVMASFTSALLPGGQPWLKAAAVAAFGAVALLGAWVIRRRPLELALLASVAAGPILVGIALGPEIGPLRARTAISASAGYYVLLAAGLSTFRRRSASLVLAGLLGLNLLSLYLLYYRNPEKVTPWATIAGTLAAQLRPGDGVIFVDGSWRWLFDRYYPDPDRLDAMGYLGPRDDARLNAFVRDRSVLYLILKNEADADPSGRVRQYVAERFTLTDRAFYPGPLAVERYSRTPGRPAP